MKDIYQFKFESDAQREQLEQWLLERGIPFRKAAAKLAEEPQGEYHAVDPALLELTYEDRRKIEQGIEQFESGQVMTWKEARVKLRKRISEFDDENGDSDI